MDSKRIFIFVMVLFGGIAFSNAVFSAWVDAPAAPPGYGTLDQNAFKPLNLSTAPQAKEGSLGIGAPLSATFPSSTYKLDVAGSVNASAFFDRQNTSTVYVVDPAGNSELNGLNISGFLTVGNTNVCLFSGVGCPPSPINYWTLSGTNLYPNLTTYNVGIGTTSPMGKLDVRDTSDRQLLLTHSPSGHVFLNAGLGGNAHLSGNLYWDGVSWNRFNTVNAGAFWWAGANGELQAIQTTAGANPVASFTQPFFINTAGNVGIGTTAPTSKLTVAEGSINVTTPSYSASTLNLSARDVSTTNDETLYLNYGNASGNVQIGGEGETKQFNVIGDVGIGTTAPTSKLTVAEGSINVTTPSYSASTLNLSARDVSTTNDETLYLNYGNASGNVQIGGEGETKQFNVIGNVDIGTTDVSSRLVVSGTTKSSFVDIIGNLFGNGVRAMILGGSYTGQGINGQDNCNTPNILTGGCSCPAGFVPTAVARDVCINSGDVCRGGDMFSTYVCYR